MRALHADSSFNVTAVTCENSKATFPEGTKVARVPDRVPDGYPDDTMKDVFTGQDAVIFVVEHAAAQRQKPLIDVAAAAGVKRWIPTEFGSNSRNAGAIEVVPGALPQGSTERPSEEKRG